MEQVIESEIFEDLLQCREQRTIKKLKLAQAGCHVVSLQLNIPGLPKTSDLLTAFIRVVEELFECAFLSENLLSKWERKCAETDISGDSVLYLFDENTIPAEELKEFSEKFEQEFELGRIVDLDVLSAEGKVISSGKAKPCFVCDGKADECRKSKRHAIEEVREKMISAIEKYSDDQKSEHIVNKVSSHLIRGLLLEVALSPKPGLVCRQSSGAHTDMDYISFLQSVSSLSPYFNKIAKLSIAFIDKDVAKALPKIRVIGLEMEREMILATNGVNTHKGAIFLMAISCFAIVRTIKRKGYFQASVFSACIQQLCRGIVQKELCLISDRVDNLTHGQQCFKKYGLQGAGARGEAEQGFPAVLHHALPYLQRKMDKSPFEYSDAEMNNLLIPVLLKIMTINNDTNVLFRHGKDALAELKKKSLRALRDWESGSDIQYLELVKWCNGQKVSPGGSADILAVTISICCCQIDFSKDKQ